MKPLGPSAPSLRQFEHIEEIYKAPRSAADWGIGDYAEVVCAHCKAGSEVGLLLRVIDEVHWCKLSCADCWQHFFEWQVRVEPVDLETRLKWESQAPAQPWFYPIAWLRRWEAHRVSRAG